MTAPHDVDDLHSQHGGQVLPSIVGIWQSGFGDLSERHDEVIRKRLKRPA